MKIFFKRKEDLTSYKLIEEFMVLANETVARYIKINKIGSIYRNHEKPKEEKIKELKKILKENGLYNNEKFKNQKDFNNVLNKINEKKFFLNDALLRTQAKAYYGNKNCGHFGLGLDYYTHFTSPSEDIQDLDVHRDLIDFVFNKNKNVHEEGLSEHLTSQEKKSDLIERNILEKACCLYIKNKNKKFFTGVIDGIESFGIFIKAFELPFSCLVRIKHRFDDLIERKRKMKMILRLVKKFHLKLNEIISNLVKFLGEKVKIIT